MLISSLSVTLSFHTFSIHVIHPPHTPSFPSLKCPEGGKLQSMFSCPPPLPLPLPLPHPGTRLWLSVLRAWWLMQAAKLGAGELANARHTFSTQHNSATAHTHTHTHTQSLLHTHTGTYCNTYAHVSADNLWWLTWMGSSSTARPVQSYQKVNRYHIETCVNDWTLIN